MSQTDEPRLVTKPGRVAQVARRQPTPKAWAARGFFVAFSALVLSTAYAQDAQACAAHGLLEPFAAPNTLTDDEQAEGWQLLFDGESLAHWRGFKQGEMPETGWEAVGGCLVRLSGEGSGEGGDIITREQYDDFELTLEWRVPSGEPGNSGIFFNVTEEADYVYETGPEMQILNDVVHPDGQNPLTSAGSNYALHAPAEGALLPPGMFNSVRIRVVGDRVEQWLNGVKMVDYELGSAEWRERVAASKFAEWPYAEAERGHLALQDHGDMVWFRNIKVRPLEGATGTAEGETGD